MKRHLTFAIICAICASAFCQTNLDQLYNTASNNFFSGNYSMAVTNFTAEIVRNPADFNAYLHRGMSKYGLHDYAAAIADYDKAILLNPHYGGFYCNRGQARLALNDMKGALADFNKAIELDPGMAIAYFNRGQEKYYSQNDFQGAISDFTKAIELHTDPQEDDIFFARGNAEMRLNDFRGAIADFTKTIKLNPANSLARTNLTIAIKKLHTSSSQ
ncbi:MAG TPA: tetratricopeptide repeat protein [Verrucomicrobiae bacterium]